MIHVKYDLASRPFDPAALIDYNAIVTLKQWSEKMKCFRTTIYSIMI